MWWSWSQPRLWAWDQSKLSKNWDRSVELPLFSCELDFSPAKTRTVLFNFRYLLVAYWIFSPEYIVRTFYIKAEINGKEMIKRKVWTWLLFASGDLYVRAPNVSSWGVYGRNYGIWGWLHFYSYKVYHQSPKLRPFYIIYSFFMILSPEVAWNRWSSSTWV